MNYLAVLGVLSGLLSAACYVPYIRDILRRTTKPERASWLIWSVLTAIGFFTQLAVGASNSLWLPGIQGLGVIVIFLLAIPYGYGGVMKRDILTLAAAAVVLIIWYITKQAAFAVYLTVLIDAMGGILTIIKSYEDPETETLITWVLSGAAGLSALIAVGSFNLPQLSYPFYIFLVNSAVAIAILLGRKRKLRAN